MSQSTSGSLRIGRIAGIEVYVHWTWLLLGYFEITRQNPAGPRYDSMVWNVLEFLSLFGIVVLHEFGHALACRSVGGRADRVVLWLLGGAAFVNPPPRPGALLWSIVAGPLVNLVLAPVFLGAYIVMAMTLGSDNDVTRFLRMMTFLDIVLLVFNLLPIYPLDGGQILQALFWFVIGRVKSLIVASIVGLVAVVGLAAVMIAIGGADLWLLLIAGFIGMQCVAGFQQARRLAQLLDAPRHDAFHCPACGEAPFQGPIWVCDQCHTRFDAFDHESACPQCGHPFPTTTCPSCRQSNPIAAWYPAREPAHEREPGA